MNKLNDILTSAMDAFEDNEGIAPVTPAARSAPRRARQPLNGRALKLEVFGEIPGHHLYIAKDEGARLMLMENAGYSFVEAGELQGFGAQAHNTDPGSRVRFVLGVKGSGEPMYGYLMKIPEEFWQQDQAGIERTNREIDAQIKGGKIGETQGTDDERRYTRPEHTYQPEAAKFFRSKPTT